MSIPCPLETPSHYDTKMQIFSSPLFGFFEWLLAVPVIFHALNGGRLILYESFGNREDNAVIKWLSSFSALYLLFLGILMIAGNQSVSALPRSLWSDPPFVLSHELEPMHSKYGRNMITDMSCGAQHNNGFVL